MKDYSDIIDLPHYVSPKRSHMSNIDRAAQFSSFAALTGYDAMVGEAARLTDGRLSLSPEEITALNESIKYIMDNIALLPSVEIIYFIPDDKKEGGKYEALTLRIRKIDTVLRQITDTENNVLNLDYIYKIKIIENE